jgi:hypothetical protein
MLFTIQTEICFKRCKCAMHKVERMIVSVIEKWDVRLLGLLRHFYDL